MTLAQKPPQTYPADMTGDHLVRLERERARQEHERWVHRPQFIGVVALGAVAVLAVAVLLVIELAGKGGNTMDAAVSTLGTVAAASVGGIAGMLTGHSRQGQTKVDAGQQDASVDGCGEPPE